VGSLNRQGVIVVQLVPLPTTLTCWDAARNAAVFFILILR